MATRQELTVAARALLSAGEVVSLDSLARSVGLTKSGVMHHFNTKRDLALALVDASAEQWSARLADVAGNPREASAGTRIRAYVDLCLQGGFDGADLAMLADVRLRDELTRRWDEQLHPWVHLDDVPDPAQRASLAAARLLGDGAWLADACNYFPLPAAERGRLQHVADTLTEGIA